MSVHPMEFIGSNLDRISYIRSKIDLVTFGPV
jgi:hypothetical protein